MQAIAHLATRAVEADVPQRPLPAPGVNPVGEDALVNLAKLARARQHTAAKDGHRQIKTLSILAGKEFRGAFGGAIERQRWLGRESLRHPVRAEARDTCRSEEH